MTTPLFLRISVRRLVQAACLALGVGFLAALFFYSRPAQYESTALILSRQFFPPGVPDDQLRPFADDVVATVTDPQVAEAIAEDTGEPAADIESGLEAERVGDNGDVEVRYTSSDGGTADEVVVAASHAALDRLAQTEVDRAETALERAEQAQAIDAVIADAQRRVEEAQESLAAAGSSSIGERSETEQLSKLPQVLRGAVTGTVIAGALVLMIFVALEGGRPTIATRQRPAVVPAPAPSPLASVPTPPRAADTPPTRPVPSSNPTPPVPAPTRVKRRAPAPDDRWREDMNSSHAETDESSAAYDNGVPTRK